MDSGRVAAQPKTGLNGNTRLVPARTSVVPNWAFNCELGIVTDGPPRFVPSIMCTVRLSILRSRPLDTTIMLNDVPKTKPEQPNPPSGTRPTGLSEIVAAALKGDAGRDHADSS